MAQDIPGDIVERVKGAGWVIPTPHVPFAEGGGAHVYLCYKHELIASLESFAKAAGPAVGLEGKESTDRGCRAVGALHKALLVDKTAVAVLKVPKPDVGNPRRARREIEAMRTLSARGLVNLLAADEGDPARWLVMQYYPRGPIRNSPELFKGNPVVVLRGALQIARALMDVHGLSLVHRDIKPSNILLGDNGEWALADFGIAFEADQTRLTRPDEVLWSRDWMPDWMTDRPLAEASAVVDIYMLVLTAYSMITGRKPRASQMDDPEFDLRKILPNTPHVGTLADFFAEHIVNKQEKVGSQSAAALCRRLERLVARLEDHESFLPLFSFISSQPVTDVPEGGRLFTAVVMNPRPCTRIAVSLRGSASGRGPPLVRLTLDGQERSLPLVEPDNWSTFTGFDLDAPLPEGPLQLRAEPSGCTMSGILIWTA